MTESRVDAAIAEYLAACDAGQPPDRAAFLARHPDLAESLGAFFADHDRMRAIDPEATGDLPAGVMNVRRIGDYEILSEIARGGMGVVYQARQVSAKRSVALKMILAGAIADEAALRRFRLEAEATATLDHPNILPVYEVGEQDGLPYFSMKLADGGTLKARIETYRRAPQATAALLAKLARAVHYAHQRGILHRDLKPGNILFDGHGEPLLADFGLAKLLRRPDDGTLSGHILGTPAYMPPEQARGDKGISTAADVYGLGAILYHCLTGQPPFRAATMIDTLRQVLEQEPPPLGNVNRDLAVIALKCLQKDPLRRYASAADLADDLDRWQRGEAIHARPVGRLERAVKWVRRNALATGFAAVVVLALVGAVVASVQFALQEKQRAEQESQARQSLDRQNDKMRTNQARYLLRPLAATQRPTAALSPVEIDAMLDIDAVDDDEVRLRVVSEALHKPVSIRQFRDRAAPLLQALLGLEPTRRDAIAPLLLARWDAPDTTDSERTDLAVLLSVGRFGPEAARRAAGQLALALNRPDPRPATGPRPMSLVHEFLACVSTLPANEALPPLLAALEAKPPLDDLAEVTQHLHALAPRLSSAEALRAARVLGLVIADRLVLTKLPLTYPREPLFGRTQRVLLERLDRADCEAAARDLLAALDAAPESRPLYTLTRSLEVVLPRLDPATAKPSATTASVRLLKSMQADRDSTWQADQIHAFGAHLDPAEARAKYREAAALLADAMFATTPRLFYLPELLRALARLEPREGVAGRAAFAARVLDHMRQLQAPDQVGNQAYYVGQLLPHLEPADAAARGRQAADLLRAALTEATRDGSRGPTLPLVRGILALAPHLKPPEGPALAETAAGAFLRLLEKDPEMKGGNVLLPLLELAPALEPRAAGKALVRTLELTPIRVMQPAQLQALTTLAPRLDAATAREVVASLLPLLARHADGGNLLVLVRGFAAVLGRLDPEEIGPRGLEAAAHLLQALPRLRDPYLQDRTADALAELATVLPAAEAGELATRITAEMRKAPHLGILRALARTLAGSARQDGAVTRAQCDEGAKLLLNGLMQPLNGATAAGVADSLESLCARVPPASAHAHSAAAVAVLVRLLPRAQAGEQSLVSRSVRKLAQHLEPAQAQTVLTDLGERVLPVLPLVRASRPFGSSALPEGHPIAAELIGLTFRLPKTESAALLLRALATTTDAVALTRLAKRLEALGQAPDAKQVGAVAEGLLKAMPGKPPETVAALAATLAVLTRYLPTPEAAPRQAEAVGHLLDALRQATRPADLATLTHGLALAAPHLDPAPAANACGAAAALLLPAAEKVLDAQEYRALVRSVIAVAPHLDVPATTTTARRLMRLLARNGDSDRHLWLTLALQSVCRRAPADERLRAGLAAFGSMSPLLAVPFVVDAAPAPLPVETLVELLRAPLCYGSARQVLLAEVGRHHGRAFRDQWEFVRFAQERGIHLEP